ncbi:MAG: uncharacterized protein KVP18_000297 [Porospora cf. gigantea A]|uniref:uncharacterized protein n=1 Tax=Porospora cf. gigantea A TaxID=2853593 RepID=UPI0035594E0E|nr:MAG: hypothetical protein KVP18_000297 [Porospora cf. gigantea A]
MRALNLGPSRPPRGMAAPNGSSARPTRPAAPIRTSRPPLSRVPPPSKSSLFSKPKATAKRPQGKTVGGVVQPTFTRVAPVTASMPRPRPLGPRGRPRPPTNYDPYSLDRLTADDRAFIDDSVEQPAGNWKQALRSLTGYDPSQFGDDGECDVSGSTTIAKEEHFSRIQGRREDLEQERLLRSAVMSSDEETDEYD